MNKDQAKGAAKNSAGKIETRVGKIVGSDKLQAKGLVKQIEGTSQRMVGDIKQAVKDSGKKKAK